MSLGEVWYATIEAASWSGDGMAWYVRHRYWLAYLEKHPIAGDKRDASFLLVPGLADERHFSFRATNPGLENQHLRNEGGRLKLQHHFEGDELYEQDATFEMTPCLAIKDIGPGVSFRSHNHPDLFMRYKSVEQPPAPAEMWMEDFQEAGGQNYRMSFSFRLIPGLYH
ncbi:AbfB domain-containing protein [Streptomyces canus]|uniref:AbfB domain-containing protein n=1 Tax=Streptomyces canus TaxID=58343 RepID=UPI00278B83DB|nr:AbfB domain-containing protein [Streptomyces canus]MDQ0757367.1 hypothetical protein [Streptomyces canus]